MEIQPQMKALSMDLLKRVRAAGGEVIIIDDNARRPQFSYTEAVEPVQLVHFGSSWMKFSSCPSKMKERMQLQGTFGSSRFPRNESRWGTTKNGVKSIEETPVAVDLVKDGPMRRYLSDTTLTAPKLPLRCSVSPKLPQRRGSHTMEDSCNEMGNASWDNSSSIPRPAGRRPSPLMMKLCSSTQASSSDDLASETTASSSSSSQSKDLALSPEVSTVSSSAAPRLPNRRSSFSNSLPGLVMPQRRGSDFVANKNENDAGTGEEETVGNHETISNEAAELVNRSLACSVMPSGQITNPLLRSTSLSTNMNTNRHFHSSLTLPGMTKTYKKSSQTAFFKHKDSLLAISSLMGTRYGCESQSNDEVRKGLSATADNFGRQPQSESSVLANASWDSDDNTTIKSSGNRRCLEVSLTANGISQHSGDGVRNVLLARTSLSSSLTTTSCSGTVSKSNLQNAMMSGSISKGDCVCNSVKRTEDTRLHNRNISPCSSKTLSDNPPVTKAVSESRAVSDNTASLPRNRLPSRPNSGLRRTRSDDQDLASTSQFRRVTRNNSHNNFNTDTPASSMGLKVPQRKNSLRNLYQEKDTTAVSNTDVMPNGYLTVLSIIAEKSRNHAMENGITETDVSSATTGDLVCTPQQDNSALASMDYDSNDRRKNMKKCISTTTLQKPEGQSSIQKQDRQGRPELRRGSSEPVLLNSVKEEDEEDVLEELSHPEIQAKNNFSNSLSSLDEMKSSEPKLNVGLTRKTSIIDKSRQSDSPTSVRIISEAEELLDDSEECQTTSSVTPLEPTNLPSSHCCDSEPKKIELMHDPSKFVPSKPSRKGVGRKSSFTNLVNALGRRIVRARTSSTSSDDSTGKVISDNTAPDNSPPRTCLEDYVESRQSRRKGFGIRKLRRHLSKLVDMDFSTKSSRNSEKNEPERRRLQRHRSYDIEAVPQRPVRTPLRRRNSLGSTVTKPDISDHSDREDILSRIDCIADLSKHKRRYTANAVSSIPPVPSPLKRRNSLNVMLMASRRKDWECRGDPLSPRSTLKFSVPEAKAMSPELETVAISV